MLEILFPYQYFFFNSFLRVLGQPVALHLALENYCECKLDACQHTSYLHHWARQWSKRKHSWRYSDCSCPVSRIILAMSEHCHLSDSDRTKRTHLTYGRCAANTRVHMLLNRHKFAPNPLAHLKHHTPVLQGHFECYHAPLQEHPFHPPITPHGRYSFAHQRHQSNVCTIYFTKYQLYFVIF